MRPGLALRAPGLLGPELPCVALADWLFWGHPVGLSLAIFCGAATLVAHAVRPGRRAPLRIALALLVLAAGLAPLVERPTLLSLAFGLAGAMLSLRLGAPRRWPGGWPAGAARGLLRLVGGPRQIVVDTLRRHRSALRRRRVAPVGRLTWWLAWIVPAAMVTVVLILFAEANPLIAIWLAAIPIPSWPDIAALLPRALFWLVILVKLWPLLRARRPRCRPPGIASATPVSRPERPMAEVAVVLFSPVAVLRALVLLDLLFAVELALDGAYLWVGLALPEGMTYAAYAHRGAYPLVATALVAAAFVLVLRRRDAPVPSRLAAALLLVFLAENLLLIASAMRRLALYVSVYALTEWRVAAFAWMGLVGIGLALIVVQGALGRGNRWLVGRSALAGLLLLYGWCILDVPRFVADYDVAQCAELKGGGPALDLALITDLGPAAIPAVDRYLLGLAPEGHRAWLTVWRGRAAAAVRRRMADWRSWSLADWRLARYLDTSGVAEPVVPETDGGAEDGT